MIKHTQRFRHRPEEGIYGDCHRTCIACLLDLEPEEVPNFGEYYGDSEAFFKAEAVFLSSKGLVSVQIPYDCTLKDLLNIQGGLNPNAFYILGGKSQSGVNHSVIGHGGEIYHDPSITQAGIVEPCTDGYYWISFLVPKAFTSHV